MTRFRPTMKSEMTFYHTFYDSRFKLLSETRQKYVRAKACSISEDASDPLIQALSESNLKPEDLKSFWKTFYNILRGKEDMVCRTANIVHVLGSLSVCMSVL